MDDAILEILQAAIRAELEAEAIQEMVVAAAGNANWEINQINQHIAALMVYERLREIGRGLYAVHPGPIEGTAGNPGRPGAYPWKPRPVPDSPEA